MAGGIPSQAGSDKQTFLSSAQQGVLLVGLERVEPDPVASARFVVDRLQPAQPGLPQRRQARIAVAVGAALEQFRVDHRGDRHRRPGFRLRHDPAAHGVEGPPPGLVQKARLARQRQPAVDHSPRLLVP